ncbi:hypothetical protein [Sediminibacillus massiliensis]|uniref:hypothetical protein n=1 Tax=Sediminibacillus massiliensis TaxID=1926277 RepID=UPI0015C3A414|nr:hypothetical protein [Sediminibacillus massiliensis]
MKKAAKHCPTCDNIHLRLKQHEQTITQLMAIIAVTNRKLTELDTKQTAFAKDYLLHLH